MLTIEKFLWSSPPVEFAWLWKKPCQLKHMVGMRFPDENIEIAGTVLMTKKQACIQELD
jgi:hypothetical protein